MSPDLEPLVLCKHLVIAAEPRPALRFALTARTFRANPVQMGRFYR
jgi:hypothetical protein